MRAKNTTNFIVYRWGSAGDAFFPRWPSGWDCLFNLTVESVFIRLIFPQTGNGFIHSAPIGLCKCKWGRLPRAGCRRARRMVCFHLCLFLLIFTHPEGHFPTQTLAASRYSKVVQYGKIRWTAKVAFSLKMEPTIKRNVHSTTKLSGGLNLSVGCSP